MRWNPLLVYFEFFPRSFVVGVSWVHGRDSIGIETRCLVIYLGMCGMRIERGIMGGK